MAAHTDANDGDLGDVVRANVPRHIETDDDGEDDNRLCEREGKRHW